jgi:phosphocarrier protein HPr
MEIEILINTIDKIKKFEEIVWNFQSDIDVIKGHYVIDAKSTLGIFSLDTSEPVTVKINPMDRDELTIFENKMEEFRVN